MHAAQLLDLYRSDRHHGIALEYGYDPRVAGLSILAIVHALKGEKQSSAEFGQQAVDHARAMKHASSLAYALMFACAMAAAMRSDSAEANRFGHELKILAKDQDSALWNAYSDVILGWSGDGNAEVISSAINQLSQTARNPWRPFFQALCADRYLRSGQREEARSLLEEALAAVDRTEERNWEAEICRLMGRLASDDTNIEEGAPQKWFRRSIKSASQSGAFELETRTREDLAALMNS